MENNGLSNENDVVFRDVILLALTGFISMVILLIPFVNPPTEEESSSTPPGNVIVELFWDDKRDVDIDLWVQAPNDIPVGYSNKGGLFFNLLRDDLGIYKDNSPVNYEVSYSRGISDGVYIANVHLYRAVFPGHGGYHMQGPQRETRTTLRSIVWCKLECGDDLQSLQNAWA